ncbi:MAG: hypothetical protein WA463_06480, partial [Terriglobales bacterium]
GLTIAHKILEDHGGRLQLAGTSAEGTTFELTLPLHHQMDADAVVPTVVVADPSLIRRDD